MPDDGSQQSSIVWPLPKFRFEVRWDWKVVQFQEVSGLDAETQIIEYRHGDSHAFTPIKMPGIKKYANVTLKKGVFTNETKFWDWVNQIQTNTVKRIPLTISLLDETGAPTMVWSLTNAWHTKITGIDLKSDSNEVAVDIIEITHEGITVVNP